MVRKSELRKEITRRLQDQDPVSRGINSRKIQEKVLSSEIFQTCKTVMTYVSLTTEVSTELINEETFKLGKRVAVPYMEPTEETIIASKLTAIKNLEKGPFGIFQPRRDLVEEIPPEEIDLILVPAIAYGKNNMRLGRGKGCYDKFLARCALSRTPTIGLAFRFQVIEELPSDPHDRPVSLVITE
ncbi:MAG: 5-formyltetrahydrofolate cyclo-ligase [Candidatus Aadella gelida]|nr:5-formyltetrahydrofolate cyclo-ligase [Candidatus Aadella gelida]